MPAIICSCGERLSYGALPCDIEWKFVADPVVMAMPDDIKFEDLYSTMNSFLKCQACGRLWVFWNGFQQDPQEYVVVGKRER